MISELQSEILELTELKNPEVLKLVLSKINKSKTKVLVKSDDIEHNIYTCSQCRYKENMDGWDYYASEKKEFRLQQRKFQHGRYSSGVSYEEEKRLFYLGMRLEQFRPCKKCLAAQRAIRYKELLEYSEKIK